MKNKHTKEQMISIALINVLLFELGGRFMDFWFTRLTHVHICYTYSLVYTKSCSIKKKKKAGSPCVKAYIYTIKQFEGQEIWDKRGKCPDSPARTVLQLCWVEITMHLLNPSVSTA